MNDQNSPNVPKIPLNSFRITLELKQSGLRLDSQLMEALRLQNENAKLKSITRSEFKNLFKNNKILIKGQAARPSSEIAAGTTYVDILLG